MGLSRRTVALAIQIVAKDQAATERIDSILAPILGKSSGFTRNVLMATAYGFLTLPHDIAQGKSEKKFKSPYPIPFDPNRPGSWGYELQCTEIAETAKTALEKRLHEIPGIKEVGTHARTMGYSHHGLVLTTFGNEKYVIDWWLTLDVSNPVVFRFSDFDLDKKGTGVPFEDFAGFL